MKTINMLYQSDEKNNNIEQMKIKRISLVKPTIIICVLSWIILFSSCFPLFRHSDREGRRHNNERHERHDEHQERR